MGRVKNAAAPSSAPEKKRKVTNGESAPLHRYKVGDNVFLKAAEGEPSFLAKIGAIETGRFLAQWWYRPEDVTGGRQGWHGLKEVFRSNLKDWNNIECVEGLARVHSLEEYERLPEVNRSDFFSRLTYNPGKGTYKPDLISVFCVCEQPYNPDKAMIECKSCFDWFHLTCIGLSAEEAASIDAYTCKQCRKKSAE
mmetsp:Transcript_15164/g.38468  ORF Transcript_15164/g.38468 Transcript_15164/m.38468 type:complete len:195 (+) Transcript_15164:215-799(+)